MRRGKKVGMGEGRGQCPERFIENQAEFEFEKERDGADSASTKE